MPNERLRATMLERGVTDDALAEQIGVDRKTVERWVLHGRTPYRRHRHAVAKELRVDESYLWPEALTRDQVIQASESEIVAVYPHRSEVPRDVWHRLFDEAEEEAGILVYAGLFIAEDAGVQRILSEKAGDGVRTRVLLGDPESPQVAQRGADEGAKGSMEAKIRNALVFYEPLLGVDGAEIRFHDTVLYNSIYFADDQILVNTHIYGMPAARAPVWHLKKIPGGQLANLYLESFEKIWKLGTPVSLE